MKLSRIGLKGFKISWSDITWSFFFMEILKRTCL